MTRAKRYNELSIWGFDGSHLTVEFTVWLSHALLNDVDSLEQYLIRQLDKQVKDFINQCRENPIPWVGDKYGKDNI